VFAVALVVARPLLSVVVVAGVKVASAPLDGPAKVTLMPDTGLPDESVTSATSDEANAVVTVADCALPLDTAIEEAAPAVFVSEKLADDETPETDAVTVYEPAVAVAVAATDATPFEPVVAVVAPSVAEAAPEGAENVTVTPDTGLPFASSTVAESDAPNAVPTVVDCDAPPVAAMEAAGPAVFVSEKLADVETPDVDAVTE
jgi:hypothetical protein